MWLSVPFHFDVAGDIKVGGDLTLYGGAMTMQGDLHVDGAATMDVIGGASVGGKLSSTSVSVGQNSKISVLGGATVANTLSVASSGSASIEQLLIESGNVTIGLGGRLGVFTMHADKLFIAPGTCHG